MYQLISLNRTTICVIVREELEILLVCIFFFIIKSLNSIRRIIPVLSRAYFLLTFFLISSSEYSSFLVISLFILIAITDVFILILSFSFSSIQYLFSKVWVIRRVILFILFIIKDTSSLVEYSIIILIFPLISASLIRIALKVSTSIL